MLILLSQRWTLECSHHLPDYEGKCQRPHGHRYELIVAISGQIDQLDDNGILIDFHVLDDIYRKHIDDVFDHQNLNDFYDSPSAEVIVRDWFGILRRAIHDEWRGVVNLEYIRLYETENCFVEYPWRQPQ